MGYLIVSDLEEVVDALRSNGVIFERYDDPALTADEKGIHELGDGRVAWFKDPDGNTFALEQQILPGCGVPPGGVPGPVAIRDNCHYDHLWRLCAAQ